MIRLFPFLLLFVFALLVELAQAQLLSPITAREVLSNVIDQGKKDLGQDAYLTAVLFAGGEYQGVQITLNPNDGKATGWVYRIYSPSLDSAIFYFAVKIFIPQVFQFPTGSLPQLPVPITVRLDDPWIDSPEAMTGAKNGGAAAFLQSHPDAVVQFAFVIENPVGNPIIPQGKFWLLTFFSPSTNDTYTCAVNAVTGTAEICGSVVSVREAANPVEILLDDVTPNPVRRDGVARVRFSVESTQNTRLTVHDVLGKERMILHEGFSPMGENSIRFRTDGLTPGSYVLRLSSARNVRSVLFIVAE